VIIAESVIDAAALWSVGLRSVIPTYGTTGLTDEIVSHLVRCRVRRAVLMLDADDAGRQAALEMTARLAKAHITARSVELPVKDAAEFIASGGTLEDVRRLITPHVLNEADITRLIETPDIETAIGLRDRALMEVLYATGIRHGEAHRLDLYDADINTRRLTERLGKGQRDRIVPLT